MRTRVTIFRIKVALLLCLNCVVVVRSVSADERSRVDSKDNQSLLSDSDVASIFKTHCVRCHGPERQKAELRLDLPINEISDRQHFNRFELILQRLEEGDMPPPEESQLSQSERAALLKTIESHLSNAHESAKAPFAGPRRLNRLEYERTIQDLLGVEIPLAGMLPEDGPPDRPAKVGASLDLSPQLVDRYLRAASKAIDEAYAGPHGEPNVVQRFSLHDSDRAKRILIKAKWWVETDDAVVLWLPHNKYICIEHFKAPVRGKYRVRVSAPTSARGKQRENQRRFWPFTVAIS